MTAIIVPYLKHCGAMKVEPTVKGLYQFVSSSRNLKYQARFRFLIEVCLPCLIKRLGIRLNNQKISSGASALFFPVAFAFHHSFYRDFYHLKYLNGSFVPIQETIPPVEPDLARFLKPENRLANSNLVKYPQKNPTENVKYSLYKAKYAHMTESSDKTDSHQGGDFIQEDALGRVVTHLKKGKIFDTDQFAQAVRSCQIHRDSEQAKGNLVSTSKSRRAKYENEIQSIAATILDKNENPAKDDDLEELNVDTLNISKIGHQNYKLFFEKKINAVPTGSIRLKPAFITKSDFAEYNKIENQRKDEIITEIVTMLTKIEFEDENEKKYFEAKVKKSNIKKDELIGMFNQLKTQLILSSN